jgi:REP element-mobilizing transposase RayT
MPQSLSRLCIHLVFSTKHRDPFLQDSIRKDLHAYMATVLKNMECPALIINSVEDHIHILLNLGRTISVSYVMEQVKKTSSKWLKTQNQTFSNFAWQAGYGAFAVSESNIPAVRQYIETQYEHHQKVTFQEEYRSFLTKHQISYDECYVWD